MLNATSEKIVPHTCLAWERGDVLTIGETCGQGFDAGDVRILRKVVEEILKDVYCEDMSIGFGIVRPPQTLTRNGEPFFETLKEALNKLCSGTERRVRKEVGESILLVADKSDIAAYLKGTIEELCNPLESGDYHTGTDKVDRGVSGIQNELVLNTPQPNVPARPTTGTDIDEEVPMSEVLGQLEALKQVQGYGALVAFVERHLTPERQSVYSRAMQKMERTGAPEKESSPPTTAVDTSRVGLDEASFPDPTARKGPMVGGQQPLYVDRDGHEISLAELDSEEQDLLRRLEGRFANPGYWSDFSSFSKLAIASLYGARGMDRKDSRNTVLFQVANDLTARLMAKPGAAFPWVRG